MRCWKIFLSRELEEKKGKSNTNIHTKEINPNIASPFVLTEFVAYWRIIQGIFGVCLVQFFSFLT